MNVRIRDRITKVLIDNQGVWLSSRQIASRLPGNYVTSRTVADYLRFDDTIEKRKDTVTQRKIYRYVGVSE